MKGKTKNLLIKILIGFVILTILGVFIFLILGKGKKENKENDMMIFRDIVTDNPPSDNILCPNYDGCIPKVENRCDEDTKKFNCATQVCDCKDGFEQSDCDPHDTRKCYPKCVALNEIAQCNPTTNKRECVCKPSTIRCGNTCQLIQNCQDGSTQQCIDGNLECVCPDGKEYKWCEKTQSAQCMPKCEKENTEYSCEKGCCVCKPEFSDFNYNSGECQKSSPPCKSLLDIPSFSNEYCSSYRQGNCDKANQNFVRIKYSDQGATYQLTKSNENIEFTDDMAPNPPNIIQRLWNINNRNITNYSDNKPSYLTTYKESRYGPYVKVLENKDPNGEDKFIFEKIDNSNKYYIKTISGLYLTVEDNKGKLLPPFVFVTPDKQHFPDRPWSNQWELIPYELCGS